MNTNYTNLEYVKHTDTSDTNEEEVRAGGFSW